MDCSRVVLPFVGEAHIRYRFGLIDNTLVAPSADTARRFRTVEAWVSSRDTVDVPDLHGMEIRIQAARPVATEGVEPGGQPGWRTIWWGTCEYQVDKDWPGSDIPAGERVYHCVDGFYRT